MVAQSIRVCVFAVAVGCIGQHNALVAGDALPEVRVEKVAERIESVAFYSRVLEQQKRFVVVLPEDYSAAQGSWPVAYFLHGRGGNERTAVDDAEIRAGLLKSRFVTVLPNGDEGWYIDSPVRTAEKYASYLEEVIAVAERQYRLSRRPAQRAMCGWSMGGYGCVRFAETHPGMFGTVVSIIGLLDYPSAGSNYPVIVERFGQDASVWRTFNPLLAADRLCNASVLLVAADQGFERSQNERFRQRLNELKIRHEWLMLPGTHHIDVVRQAMPAMLRYLQGRIGTCNEREDRVGDNPGEGQNRNY